MADGGAMADGCGVSYVCRAKFVHEDTKTRRRIDSPWLPGDGGACFERAPQRFRVRRAEDAALGDDSRDQLMRGDVERGVANERAGGCELVAADMRHFASIALLDRNLRAVRRVEVDRRERRRDIKRDAVLA